MGKQEDFVLRALEERDVRFVRLWFTDVLGSLKSVAVAPAELVDAVDQLDPLWTSDIDSTTQLIIIDGVKPTTSIGPWDAAQEGR